MAPKRLLSLAASLALVLLLAASSGRAEDITIFAPDDGAAVLYSHDSAPDAILALDPKMAPDVVPLLFAESDDTLMPDDGGASPAELVLASAPVAASSAVEEAESLTEEKAMVEATVSMLEAALAEADADAEPAVPASPATSENVKEVAAAVSAAAVAGQPAPQAAADATTPSPSPSAAVVPTAQLFCPPTCPAGTRCRQGGRGTCEPFSVFDCSGGKCAPSAVPAPPVPTPTTGPPVCKAKCTDVPPTPNWSCGQQMSFGACEQGWMVVGNYCQITCGRCPLECYDCSSMCLDKAPDRNGCAAQAGWGKCGVSFEGFSFFLSLFLFGERSFKEKEKEKRGRGGKKEMILTLSTINSLQKKISFSLPQSLFIKTTTGNLDGGVHALVRQVPRQVLFQGRLERRRRSRGRRVRVVRLGFFFVFFLYFFFSSEKGKGGPLSFPFVRTGTCLGALWGPLRGRCGAAGGAQGFLFVPCCWIKVVGGFVVAVFFGRRS